MLDLNSHLTWHLQQASCSRWGRTWHEQVMLCPWTQITHYSVSQSNVDITLSPTIRNATNTHTHTTGFTAIHPHDSSQMKLIHLSPNHLLKKQQHPDVLYKHSCDKDWWQFFQLLSPLNPFLVHVPRSNSTQDLLLQVKAHKSAHKIFKYLTPTLSANTAVHGFSHKATEANMSTNKCLRLYTKGYFLQ